MFFHLERMATMMLRIVTFNEIKCRMHVTPFGGRNPKVGVNHVHLCLSCPFLFMCLIVSFIPAFVMCIYGT